MRRFQSGTSPFSSPDAAGDIDSTASAGDARDGSLPSAVATGRNHSLLTFALEPSVAGSPHRPMSVRGSSVSGLPEAVGSTSTNPLSRHSMSARGDYGTDGIVTSRASWSTARIDSGLMHTPRLPRRTSLSLQSITEHPDGSAAPAHTDIRPRTPEEPLSEHARRCAVVSESDGDDESKSDARRQAEPMIVVAPLVTMEPSPPTEQSPDVPAWRTGRANALGLSRSAFTVESNPDAENETGAAAVSQLLTASSPVRRGRSGSHSGGPCDRSTWMEVSTTAVTEVDDATGQATALNDIDLFDELGRGAYGRVMLGVSPRFEQPVAVKEVRRANAELSPAGMRAVRLRQSVDVDGGDSVDRTGRMESSAMMALVHEAEVLSRLQHPNIVALHEVVDDPAAEAVYLVMQYVQGRQAAAMEAPAGDDTTEGHGAFRCARQPAAVVELVAHGAAAALAYCHRERKVVHGDVKPENILLQDAAPGAATLGRCGFERAMLTDFGVALAYDAFTDAATSLTPASPGDLLLPNHTTLPRDTLAETMPAVEEAAEEAAPVALTREALVTVPTERSTDVVRQYLDECARVTVVPPSAFTEQQRKPLAVPQHLSLDVLSSQSGAISTVVSPVGGRRQQTFSPLCTLLPSPRGRRWSLCVALDSDATAALVDDGSSHTAAVPPALRSKLSSVLTASDTACGRASAGLGGTGTYGVCSASQELFDPFAAQAEEDVAAFNGISPVLVSAEAALALACVPVQAADSDTDLESASSDDSESCAQQAFTASRTTCPRVAPAVARGTPAFLAPELLITDVLGMTDASSTIPTGRPTPASDCWALGVTLFALKYGRLPFRGATRAELARAIREDELVFPTALETSESPDCHGSAEPVDPREERKWRALLRALLDKDPARRLTAEELRDAAVLRRAREFAEAS